MFFSKGGFQKSSTFSHFVLISNLPQKKKKRHDFRAVFFGYFRLFVNKTNRLPKMENIAMSKKPILSPQESDTMPISSGATVLPTEPEELIIPETAPECSGCCRVASATRPDQIGAQAKPTAKQRIRDRYA